MRSGFLAPRAAAAILIGCFTATAALAEDYSALGGMPWHGWYIMADETAADGPYGSEQECETALAVIDIETTQPPRCQYIVTGPDPVLHPVAGYHQWRLLCGSGRMSGRTCNIVQDLVAPRSHRIIGQITVLMYAGKTTVLTVKLPLNVALENGLSMKVGNEVHDYSFYACLPDGCYARIPVIADLDVLLAGTSDGSVAVTAIDGKIITSRFSLAGLKQARTHLP